MRWREDFLRGWLSGSVAKASIDRLLASAIVRLEPAELHWLTRLSKSDRTANDQLDSAKGGRRHDYA